jgi:hypothetical protein
VFTPLPEPEPASATLPTNCEVIAMATAVAIGLNLKEMCWGFFTMSVSLKLRNDCLNLFA